MAGGTGGPTLPIATNRGSAKALLSWAEEFIPDDWTVHMRRIV